MPIAFEPPPTQAITASGWAAAQFRHLGQALATDNRLEVAHHHRVRVRTSDGPDDVEGVVDVGGPSRASLRSARPSAFSSRFDRHDGRPEKLHAIDVLHLALDVLRAHVHHAFHAVARRHRRGRHTVHSGAGFGDHTRFAHARARSAWPMVLLIL